MRRSGLVSVLALCTCFVLGASGPTGPDPDRAIDELMAGNHRFAVGHSRHPNLTAARMGELAKGQHPIAVVLSCSDSRVPPEIVFDRGLGDLFVVRVAGNVADDNALGSMEYAVEHLGVRTVVVLGHKRCGAVSAVVEGGEAHGHIRSLVDALLPAVNAAKGRPGDLVDNAVHVNVAQVVNKLRASEPILAESVHAHRLKVVGAYYDLDSGKVTLMP